jgi:hypothetical protein
MEFKVQGSEVKAAPLSRSRRWTLDGGLRTLLAAAIGLLVGLAPSWGVPADVVCAGFLAIALFRGGLKRLPDTAIVYVAAIFLSLIPALMISPRPPQDVGLALAALLVPFAFYLAGLHLGGSPGAVRFLLVGLSAAVIGHAMAAAAGHQLLAADLAAYGFGAAAVLLSLGTTFENIKVRWTSAVGGLVAAALFMLAAPGAGAVAALVGCALYALIGWRSVHRRSFHLVLGSLALLIFFLPFAGGWRPAFQAPDLAAAAWFPFGEGVGRGEATANGVVAVASELGVLGMAAFAGMIALPALLMRRRADVPERLRYLLVSLVPACAIFLVHHPLHRDRIFLLFLGLATAHVLSYRRPPVLVTNPRVGALAQGASA